MNKRLKGKNGITLVALVITIIVLLILAGISIQALTNQGIFAQAKEAKKRTENAQKDEYYTLQDYMKEIDGINAISVTAAQADTMLTTTTNTFVKDAYGNVLTVPAGFKIKVDDTTNNATTVDKGIVIIDSDENEFVWIPVGKIYTDEAKTEANAKTIELGRYVFKEDGTIDTTLSQTEPEGKLKRATSESFYYTEAKASDTTSNTHAKDIEKFRKSVETNRGYYIGRYEARTGTERSAKTDVLTTLTTKASEYVYNYITQPQAADLARNMYQEATTFTSDLMNSYAWDTATLFLQTFGTNSKYSRKNSINSSLATTGTNNQETKDVQCNVYDMASNCIEWTTETCSDSSNPCVPRGGYYDNSDFYMCTRGRNDTSLSYKNDGFRILLFVNV